MMHITSIDRIAHLNMWRKTFPPDEFFATILNSLSCQLLPMLLDQQLEKFSCLSSLPKVTEY